MNLLASNEPAAGALSSQAQLRFWGRDVFDAVEEPNLNLLLPPDFRLPLSALACGCCGWHTYRPQETRTRARSPTAVQGTAVLFQTVELAAQIVCMHFKSAQLFKHVWQVPTTLLHAQLDSLVLLAHVSKCEQSSQPSAQRTGTQKLDWAAYCPQPSDQTETGCLSTERASRLSFSL